LPFASLRQHYLRAFERLATEAGQRGEELRAEAERMLGRHSHHSALSRFTLMAELYGHPERYRLHQRVDRPAQALLLLANADHTFSRDEQSALVKSYATPTVTRYLNGGQWIGLLPAQEFERKLKLHLMRFSVPLVKAQPRAAARGQAPSKPVPSQNSPDGDTLDWRQDRRLGCSPRDHSRA
jgi:hypothetical protein